MTATDSQTDPSSASHGADEKPRDVILYDGVCGLCNRLVRFVLARDRDARFRFAWLQSPAARELLKHNRRGIGEADTLYLVLADRDGKRRVLEKSAAVIEILRRLGGPWRASAMLRVLPAGLLDAGYDLVARNRYRIFGRSESCAIPDPRWRDRFLD